MLDFVGRNPERAIVDIAVRLVLDQGVDAVRFALVAPSEGDDVLRQGRGEQQRAAVLRRGVEDELQILAEAEIEHFIGFVKHHDAHLRGVETAALQVVSQAARGADDDMAAIGKCSLLAAHVHAANA
jgi:hypothetical protein